MFFQISPVRKEKKIKPIIKERPPEKVEVLSLGPFAAAPKLSFDGTKLGESATCKLILKNPTKQDITIFLIKKVPEELNVHYSWEGTTIERESEVLFEIIWTPRNKEASYHKITFENDAKTVHRDVPIIFKTASPLKKSRNEKYRKSPTKKYYSSKPPYISPKRYYLPKAKSVHKKSPSPIKDYHSQKNPFGGNTFDVEGYTLRQKENVETVFCSEAFRSPTNVTFELDSISKRDTFVFKREQRDVFDDSLETNDVKRSPLSTYNGIALTPDVSLGSYFKQKSSIPMSQSRGFEYELNNANSFCFTPQKENILPDIKWKTEKPSFDPSDVPSCLNLSNETYTKSRLSPMDNASFETYVKGNLSGGTFTKDASFEYLSPLSAERSPTIQKAFVPTNSSTPPFSRYLQEAGKRENNTPNFVFTKPNNVVNITNMFNHTSLSFSVSTPEVGKFGATPENLSIFTPSRRHLNSIVEEESACNPPKIRKRSDLDLTANYARPGGGLTGPNDWSRRGGSAVRVAKRSSGLNLKRLNNNVTCTSSREEAISKISKRDTSTVIIQNPFLLAATDASLDPFLAPQLYVNDEWIDRQEVYFKKWLNSLLTPPQELYSEEKVVDVAKVWQECKKREVAAAPTKEYVSNKYHVNVKLNNLRKSARNLFTSKEISDVLTKVVSAVDKGKLGIRQDKDVHLNLTIKSNIMSLLLSYNSLWLRIGLETIYNEIIPLHSNSDIVGLSTFLIDRLFKHPYLVKKYKSVHSPKYAADFNKFFLKKFLILVYFLDRAKCKKLIAHDPCLFCKTGAVKESKELLLALARELLSAVGDITKVLKFSGYVVEHVQTYIHEFDYAVKNLGVDLRDGIRLTKIMEIILLQENLTKNLRVPAISRLQKVHNMKVVFDALRNAGFGILHDVQPKDIVDGHREKTMSFMWQIIYKFETPLMAKCATTIQTWYRSLPVAIKRRRLRKIHSARRNAALAIQRWYNRRKLAEKLERFADGLRLYRYVIGRNEAAAKIQSYYRMYRQRRVYLEQIRTVRRIQIYSKGWLIRNVLKRRIKSAIVIQSYFRTFVARREFLKIINAVRIVQTRYRNIRRVKMEVTKYRELKMTAVFVQRTWRSKVLAKNLKKRYDELKLAVMNVQRRFRANRARKIEQDKYRMIKTSVVRIQTWYRSAKTTRTYRLHYLSLKRAVLIVEQRRLALQTMKKQRELYLASRQSCMKIQRYYRGYKLTRDAKERYVSLKTAATFTQRTFRAKLSMRKEVAYYTSLRRCVVLVQRRFRANRAMTVARSEFLSIKKAAVTIQSWYRTAVESRKCRDRYLSLRRTVRLVEATYEAKLLMRKDLTEYRRIRNAVVVIQTRYKAVLAARICERYYNRLKLTVTLVQRRFRANRTAQSKRNYYLELRRATITVQTRYRAKRAMLSCNRDYQSLKKAAVVIQNRYRAKLLMIQAKTEYRRVLTSAITLQRAIRAKKLMSNDREKFLTLKTAVVHVQTRWRARKVGGEVKKRYDDLRRAAITLQRKWRAVRRAREDLRRYESLRKAAVFVQRRWRGNELSRRGRREYLALREAASTLQRYWRARISGRIERRRFIDVKNATVSIQRRFRVTLLARIERRAFENIRKAAIIFQRRWRARLLSKMERNNYQNLRSAAIVIQHRYRAKIASNVQRCRYLELRKHTVSTQRRWRAKIEGRKQREDYELMKKTAVFIQQKFRAKREMKIERRRYETSKRAAVTIQRWFRANLIANRQRKMYLIVKTSVVTIQKWYRSLALMWKERAAFLVKKRTVLAIQKWARGYLVRKKYAKYFTPEAREQRRIAKAENDAVTKIQAIWRAYVCRRAENPVLSKIRERCIKACKTAVLENTLNHRCKVALQTIAHENSTLFHINNALGDIDYGTRRSKQICVRLGKLLPDQLYLMLSSTSRSLPEMNACVFSVNILINFNKLKETKDCSFVPGYIEKLVTLMMHWCDKESLLFPALCTLFWLFAHTPQWRRYISNLPNIKQKFERIKSLVSRKENMVRRQAPKGGTVSVFVSDKNLAMPSLTPDWGLDYKKSPFAFTNSVHAFNSLMNILNF